jgi:DNA excision repair protein ERCC-2
MRFDLDGLDVFFPYDYLYKEQYEYMFQLKRAIDQKGHALLEMPTGTGKTVCLISLVTAYQYQYPKTGKLIYCTRTVQEMQKCLEEVKKVIDYRVKMVGKDGGKVLGICLSSRRNMCIHPRVLAEGDREAVDSLCRNMTASWVRARAGRGRGYIGNLIGSGTTSSSGASSSRDAVVSAGATTTGGSADGVGANAGAEEGSGSCVINGVELCEFYEKYDQDGTNAGNKALLYICWLLNYILAAVCCSATILCSSCCQKKSVSKAIVRYRYSYY